MEKTLADDSTRDSKSLLDLPTELRRQAYDKVFLSTTIHVERGHLRAEEEEELLQESKEPTEDEPRQMGITLLQSAKHGLARVLPLPEQLSLVCRAMHEEIGDRFHSKVTYRFPSTVAFIDVLSQWSPEKIKAMRHAYIAAFPLPLYPIDNPNCYHTHDTYDALPMFPGLQLDTLTVENIWLDASGEGLDGWCRGATFGDVTELIQSSGWKELRYLSGPLGFFKRQHQELEELIQKIGLRPGDADFECNIAPSRPVLSGLETTFADGRVEYQDTGDDEAEVLRWDSAHDQARQDGIRSESPAAAGEQDGVKKVMVWARRGKDADYKQDGSRLSEAIRGLMNKMTWTELRETDDYLVNDGMNDPAAHL